MSVRIQLDREWSITADKYAWHLSKYRKGRRDGMEVVEWTPKYHYSSLESLLHAEVERRIRLSDATTFTQLLEARDKAVRIVRDALRPYGYKINAELIDGYNDILQGGE